jgi:hypothetical protein
MNSYTVSRLALEAGGSVHIVRDYLLRGLLRLAWSQRMESEMAFGSSDSKGPNTAMSELQPDVQA